MDQDELDAKIARHADSEVRFMLARIPLPAAGLERAQCCRAMAENLNSVAEAIEDASSPIDQAAKADAQAAARTARLSREDALQAQITQLTIDLNTAVRELEAERILRRELQAQYDQLLARVSGDPAPAGEPAVPEAEARADSTFTGNGDAPPPSAT